MKIPSSFKKLLAIPVLLVLALYFNSCKKDNPVPVPVITSFSPTSGAPGAVVTITGKNFSTTVANNTVKFNNTVATVTTATATDLTLTVPQGASTGKISVATNGGTATSASDFTVLMAPEITSFSPATLAIGGTLTITGTNFSTNPADNVVMINNVPVTVTAATATQLTIVLPQGVTTGKITLALNGVTISSTTDITVVPPLTITSFSPLSGLPGATVTITGTNFSTVPASNTVKFNNILATVTAATATQLTVTVPNGLTGASPITVTTYGVTVTADANFTVPPPTITSFSPTSGVPGATLTITGTNFNTNIADNTVTFLDINGGKVNGTITAATSTQLTVTLPSGVATGRFSVTANGATVTTVTSFTVPDQTFTSFSPTYGLVGSTVIITGTNFSPVPAYNSVIFNSTPATVIAATSTQLTVTVPTGISGINSILLRTFSGALIITANDFEVLKDVPRNGLIALYPFSNHGKETVTVSTTRDFDMAATTAPVYTPDRFGTNSFALSLNGTKTQYATVSSQIVPNTPWTISFWMQYYAIGNQALLSTMSAGVGMEIGMGTANAGEVITAYGDDGVVIGGNYTLNPAYNAKTAAYLSSALANTWINITMTYDGTVYSLYLNGSLKETNSITTKTPLGSQLTFGATYLGTAKYYTGRLDDLIIYNRAVTATEVTEIYNQTITKY